MTRAQANQILDAVKSGRQSQRLSHLAIAQALRVTGDLPPPAVRNLCARRVPNFGRTV